MDKPQKQLLTFIGTYLKNKDLFFKRIEKIEEKTDSLYIKYKQKETSIIAETKLDDEFLKKLDSIKNISIVLLNTKANLDFLIKHWNEFAKHAQLIIYFANPYSRTEKIWTIMPHIHNKIADNESLTLGLKTMAENVDETTKEEFKKIVEG